MRRAAWAIPVAWALWVGLLAAGVAVWSGDQVSTGLLGGAALVSLAGAGVYAYRQTGVGERLITETSPAPALIAIGLTLALNGVAFGLWLILIGAEVTAFGIALLIREQRDAR